MDARDGESRLGDRAARHRDPGCSGLEEPARHVVIHPRLANELETTLHVPARGRDVTASECDVRTLTERQRQPRGRPPRL